MTTKSLNQAVKRNATRFPEDFTFRLTTDEAANLKSQFVTSSGWGGRRRSLPLAFTELARKVDALEGKYDSQFRVVFDALRALMEPPKIPHRRIGF